MKAHGLANHPHFFSQRTWQQLAALLICAGVVLFAGPSVEQARAQALPPPVADPHSTEITLNSRISYHGGWSASYTDQQLGDVLDAAARGAWVGAPPTIYAATPQNVYRYDHANHSLILHKAGDWRSDGTAAFEVGIAADNIVDAGASMHLAQLESVALWTGTASQLASCPRATATTYANNNWNPPQPIDIAISYGRRNVSGITSTLVAISSDGSLPNPHTDGSVYLDNALASLLTGREFSSDELTAEEVSQVLWGAYGCSNHFAAGGKAGLVCASAVANYYLVRHIYSVGPAGVYRYHVRRPPGTDQTTRDHRIELVTPGDVRAALRSALPALPTAPQYIIICIATTGDWPTLEVGFAGMGAMLQASTIGLQSFPDGGFTSGEQSAIRFVTGIPTTDTPIMIVSYGRTGTSSALENDQARRLTLSLDRTIAFGGQVAARYELPVAAMVDLGLYDCQGQRVRMLASGEQSAGVHEAGWNGRDDGGRAVLSGVYFCRLRTGNQSDTARLVVVR